MTGQKSRGPQGGIGGDDNCLTVLILDRLSLAHQFALIHTLQTSLQEKNAPVSTSAQHVSWSSDPEVVRIQKMKVTARIHWDNAPVPYLGAGRA